LRRIKLRTGIDTTPFKEWINNPKFVSDKKAFIIRHLIPNDENIWTEDKFNDFIEQRGIIILSKIKENIV